VRIRLLGGFAVEHDGAVVPDEAWRLRRARTLVKLLALAPGQRLHRERVIDLLWPEREPVAAANSLHQVLHAARRALSSTGEPLAGVLELSGELVVLHNDGPLEVDADAFTQAAARALQTHDPVDVRAALAQYSGELLPEDPYEQWVSVRRDELGATHRALLVEHAGLLAGSGNAEAATLALGQVLEADPLHEPAVRALMTILSGSGRRSEALSRYERLRDQLEHAYGTHPDPQTRQLFRELLEHTAEPVEPTVRSTGRLPDRRHNLPPSLSSFVGRLRELAEIRRLLGRTRILTLTGPGGAGKTRLAEELGRRVVDSFPDGVWLADLVPVADPRLLADVVAAALGLQPGAGRDPVQAVVSQLANTHALVVFDNCEHLLGGCARLVTALLHGCPRLTVLATSREPLHVPGEITFRVPSLEVPDAVTALDPARLGELSSVRLFYDRARQVRPELAFDEPTLIDVATICRRLDGIPLAIELAAARVAHLQVGQIAERLGDALSVLGRGPRGYTRHATLRAALEWSHSLLTEDETVLLRRLAAFTGGFSLAAAESVCTGGSLGRDEVLDCLGRLVDKSLVQTDTSGREVRYRLLDTVRQFARERLAAAGEATRIDSAQCDYYLALVAEHDDERDGRVPDRPPPFLDAVQDNLRAALSWAVDRDPQRALRLAARLWRFWLARGHFLEGQRWLEQVVTVAPEPSADRSRALVALAVFDCRRGRSDRLRALADDAVAAIDACADPDGHLLARLQRGFLVLMTFDLDAAEHIGELVGRDARVSGNAPVGVAATWLRALVALCREDSAAAFALLDECLNRIAEVDPSAPPFFPALTICMPLVPVGDRLVPVFEETMLLGSQVGADQAVGYLRSARGYASRFAGDYRAAHATVAAAVEVFRGLRDRAGLAVALNHLGCIERDRADAAATDHLEEALRLRRAIGDRRGENLTWCNLGLLAASTGDVGRARTIVGEALAGAQAIDDAPSTGGALLALGVVELYAGERRAAQAFFERAIEALAPQGFIRIEAWTRLVAGELAAEFGERARAQRHQDRAAAVFARLRCRVAAERVTGGSARTPAGR
jgi:predicted ATPase/DNA-binding SARP family transcriptional activator